jgi:serine/threonine-protein kinase
MQEQFGRYILLERVAIGGMAEIFKAKAPGLGGFEKILAIKRLHPRYSEDADFIEMLIDEARISVELSHSNIAQIFDLGKVDDHYYIAMEYIDGRDLYRCQKRLKDRRVQFPIDGAAYIAAEACGGLDFAHRKKDARGRPLNIVHRDVSPQNVLLSFEGEVKLVDFGIAKAALRAYETESGIIKGKFYYMSPEQARGEPLDHRTDVFSLGIVLYEMMTGELLYKEDDDATLLSRVRKADIEPPTTLRPEIPRTLERIVMKALAREREERYASALHLQKDLNKYLRSVGASFGRARLAKMMREVFLDEAPGDESEELDAFMLRSRAEFGNDRYSLISEAVEASFDQADATQDLTATDEAPGRGAAENGLRRPERSELIELASEEIHLVDYESHNDPSTMNMDGPPEAALQAYDSIDLPPQAPAAIEPARRPPADLEYDPFEDESTQARDHRPAAHAPPADLDDLPEPDESAPRIVVVPPPRAPDLKPVARAARPAPEAAAFAAAPTPVPERSGRPAERPARPRPAPVAPARSRNEVPTDPGRDAAAGSIHRPLRARRAGQELPTAMGQPVTSPGSTWLTRERVLFGGVVLLVLVLAAVLTSLVIRPGAPEKPMEPATVTVGAAPTAQATLSIKSFPSGAKVKVGQQWLPESTPTSALVPAGKPVRITVRLGEDYEVFEKEVVPEAGRDVVVDAQLEKLRGTITVESQPADATVYLDGQFAGRTPITLGDLPVDRAARVRVLRDGFEPDERTVEWSGKREHLLDIRLRAAGSSAGLSTVAARSPPPQRASPPPRAAPPRVVRSRVVEDEPPPRRSSPPPAPVARRGNEGGKGFISVQSRRWGSVYVNGNQVAPETPLFKYAIDAGTHSVQLYYEGNRSDPSERRRVTVERGETTLVKF